MTPEQEREARLRAVRMMQDDIYRGIGATDRPEVDGRSRRSDADRMRADAGAMARDLTRGGTQPLRDELARDDMEDEDSVVMSRAKSGMKPKGGY